MEAEHICGSELVGGCSPLPPSSSHQPEKFVPSGLSSVSNSLLSEGTAILVLLLLLKRREARVRLEWMSPVLGHCRGGASEDGVSLGAALCPLSWHNEGLFLICVSPGGLLLSVAVFETHPLFSENQ